MELHASRNASEYTPIGQRIIASEALSSSPRTATCDDDRDGDRLWHGMSRMAWLVQSLSRARPCVIQHHTPGAGVGVDADRIDGGVELCCWSTTQVSHARAHAKRSSIIAPSARRRDSRQTNVPGVVVSSGIDWILSLLSCDDTQ